MIPPRHYFPWKLVRHFVFNQIFALTILVIGGGFSLRYFVFKTFSTATDTAWALGEFDDYLTGLGAVIFICGSLYIFWVARLYFRPLGRLLQRARVLRRVGLASDEIIDDDIESEEPGEWADLTRTVGKLHSDLKIKTEQFEREREELAALLSAVSEAILAVDRDGVPLFFNSQFALLFGFKATSRRSQSLGEIFRAPPVLEAFHSIFETGTANTVSLTLHTAHHKLPRHFTLAMAPLRNKDSQDLSQNLYGAVGIFHDITEMKQAEQIRIEFVGNASHELRTPLTSIKGYVETVKEDIRTGRVEGVTPFLEIISRNVDRLIFLVNDLLDLSTIESGAELQRAIVDTREVTEGVLRQLEVKRAEKSLTIATHYQADTLMADARRIEQVLVNLVHNAIKYVPDGKQIDITWKPAPAGGTVLTVRDNGPGIPAEHQARLFERFYRIDSGRARDQGGTGLGLSIVKHIMIKHGGRIQLHSRIGEGSEFVCEFPN